MREREPAPAGPRRLRRDAQRNRERILAAARQVFAERGLEATLDDVASRAGLGVGTVYRRYRNKYALLDEIFEEEIGVLVALAREAAARPDAWHALVDLLELLEQRFSTNRGLQDLVVHMRSGQDRVASPGEQLLEPIACLVSRAKAEGQLRADFAATDIPMVHTMLAGVIEHTHDIQPELWRRYFLMIVDGMRSARGTFTPIETPPLEPQQIDAALSSGGGRRRDRPSRT